jgi:glycosyltransferase involved in cell wall biosynthesis
LADLLVSPRTAGTSVPLKIYSYLYSAKPIIATQIPAHTQVLNHKNSLLVDPHEEAFAAGILLLLQDPDLRDRFGKQAYEYAVNNYDLTNYLDKLEEIYPRPVISQSILPQDGRSQYSENQVRSLI